MGIDTADPVGSLDRWASREQHRLSVLQARKAQALEVLGNAEASREKLKQDQQQWSTRYSKDLHASMLRSGSKFGTTAGSDGMSNVISAKKEIDDADTDILRAKVEEKEYRLKKKLEETEKEREAWREQHVGHRKALQSKAVSILDQAKQKREHRSTELREKWNRERAFLAQSEAEAQADLLAKKREHLSHERAHLGAWKDTLKQKEKQRERLFEEKEKRSKERLELLKNQKKNSEKQKWNQYNALLMKRHGMFMERMEEFHGFQRNLVEQHKSKDEWVSAMRENESLMQQDRSNQLSHYYEYMRGNLGVRAAPALSLPPGLGEERRRRASAGPACCARGWAAGRAAPRFAFERSPVWRNSTRFALGGSGRWFSQSGQAPARKLSRGA
mmetsp:Transcript_23463/g.73613  ORF Transcript_23463/g.73613 Transcript_23463/m.73613 type:complete len:388 (-) Transcript_23463:175-1338(-)